MVSTRNIQITNHHGLRPDGIDKGTFPPGLEKNILRYGKVKYFFPGDTLRLIHRLSKTENKYLTVPTLRIKKKSGRGGKDVYLKKSFARVPGQEDGYSLFAPGPHLPGTDSPNKIERLRKGNPL